MTRPRPLDVPKRVPDSGRRAEVRVIERQTDDAASRWGRVLDLLLDAGLQQREDEADA